MKYLELLLVCFLFFSCSSNEDSIEVDNQDSEIRYAKNLEIRHKGNDILIHILSPENHKIEKRYFLRKNQKSITPKGYTLLNQPIKSIVALSSTHIGMLAKLNLTSIVSGISSHLYVHDPLILKNYHLLLIDTIGSYFLVHLHFVTYSNIYYNPLEYLYCLVYQ